MYPHILAQTNAATKPQEYKLYVLIVFRALKLEKSAISKVQKHIICILKNGKIQFLHQKKVRKLHFW